MKEPENILQKLQEDFKDKFNGLIDLEIYENIDIYNLKFKFRVEENNDNEYIVCYNQRTDYKSLMIMVYGEILNTIDISDLIKD